MRMLFARECSVSRGNAIHLQENAKALTICENYENAFILHFSNLMQHFSSQSPKSDLLTSS